MAYILPNSVFIHTPKTAGQWVAVALENAGLLVDTLQEVHASPDELKAEPGLGKRTFLFTFVRHPAAWYQSMWSHQMDEGWDAIDDPDWFSLRWVDFWAEFTRHCASNSFEQFVLNCIRNYPEGLVSGLFAAYTDRCSFVGKQENLHQDLQKALRLAGETYDSDKLLATRARNVRGRQKRRMRATRYSPELLERVMETEAGAIAKFGYDSTLTDFLGDRWQELS